jgi:hypothetical protein
MLAPTKRIGSGALLESPGCDDRAIAKYSAAPAILRQSASQICGAAQ